MNEPGDWLIWIMVHGDAGEPVETSPFDLDRDHIAFEDRVLLADLPEAQPQLLLMPEPVREGSWPGRCDAARERGAGT